MIRKNSDAICYVSASDVQPAPLDFDLDIRQHDLTQLYSIY